LPVTLPAAENSKTSANGKFVSGEAEDEDIPAYAEGDNMARREFIKTEAARVQLPSP
jgi:hypothetical protein